MQKNQKWLLCVNCLSDGAFQHLFVYSCKLSLCTGIRDSSFPCRQDVCQERDNRGVLYTSSDKHRRRLCNVDRYTARSHSTPLPLLLMDQCTGTNDIGVSTFLTNSQA